MKYIITESRLESLIFKYLDSKLDGIDSYEGKFSDIVFALPGEEYGLLAWTHPDRLYIFRSLVEEISAMFSIEEYKEINKIIGRYIENKWNLEVASRWAVMIKDHDVLKVNKK
jgi:hypothetical protein